MNKTRLEAFSDGVIAVAITIMVLELHAPHSYDLESLRPLLPQFFSYILGFLYIGIYWNNHHHLLHAAERVTGMVLWANLHLLFWLTLIPFVTGWVGQTGFDTWPVVAYGFVLLMCGVAWQLLRIALVRHHSNQSVLATALRRPYKEWASIILYAVGIAAALIGPRWGPDGERLGGIAGCLCYGIVASLWFVPDTRIERAIHARQK